MGSLLRELDWTDIRLNAYTLNWRVFVYVIFLIFVESITLIWPDAFNSIEIHIHCTSRVGELG